MLNEINTYSKKILSNSENPNNHKLEIPENEIQEKIIDAKSGGTILCLLLLSLFLNLFLLGGSITLGVIFSPFFFILSPIFFFLFIITCCCFSGLFVNNINEAHVLTFFGEYIGTVKKIGYCFANPFSSHKTISLKSNNLNGAVIKINDKVGNPIMMGCVVVWKIKDTAKATFAVENYSEYVHIQSDCAVRDVGCQFPYESDNEKEICLRSGSEEISKVLVKELSERLKPAGIEVIEARITELSYANEIASVMLKRQAADAVIAARQKIVEGAVSIVGHALNSLSSNEICDLPREKKAKLASNMLVVLCGENQGSSAGHSTSAPRLAEGFNKYG